MGTDKPLSKKDRSDLSRFENKFIPEPNTGCWIWTACMTNKGYGEFRLKDNISAHRASWILYRGELPKINDSHHGICVLHKCDNRLCVNPEHLFLGTNSDNIKDMFYKKRQPDRKGIKNGKSKLNNIDIKNIRKLYPERSVNDIARLYNVSLSAIYHILRKRNWSHV